MIKVIGRREVSEIVVMFLIVQLVGLGVAMAAYTSSSLSVIRAEISGPQTATFAYALDAILICTAVLILLNRHKSHHKIFADNVFYLVLEATVVTATSFFFFLAVYNILLPSLPSLYIYGMSIATPIILIIAKDLHPHFRNAVTISSSIGVGLLLGMYLTFTFAFIALAVVAVYDFIAVFITKSMIKIAKVVSGRDMALIISTEHLEAVPKGSYSEKVIKEYEEYLHRTHEDTDPRYKRILSMGKLPVLSQIQLGEGDLGLPLMAIVSVYYTFTNIIVSFAVMAGSVAGLLAVIWILKSYERPLPAIPPLFTFMALATGGALLLTGTLSSYFSTLLPVTVVALITFVLLIARVARAERKSSEAS